MSTFRCGSSSQHTQRVAEDVGVRETRDRTVCSRQMMCEVKTQNQNG